MTLLVGIKCSDGVVMAADSAATYGSLGQSTIRQTSSSKLTIIDDRVVVACTGPVGLGQRIKGAVTELWAKKELSNKKSWEAMTIIRQRIFDGHIGMELNVAGMAKNLVGPAAHDSAISATLLAVAINREPTLFQFDQQGAPEEATTDLPFVALGSGQPLADPFLAFVRRIFWPNALPNIQDGVFAALWTVTQACLVAPGGIGLPVDVVVLDKKTGTAKHLTSDELGEHNQLIVAAEDSLRSFRSSLGADGAAGAAPPIPPSPST